jgi:hypothetical protein
MLRLFRLFDIFSQSRFLLPTNTLIKTIIKQRNALLGSQIMVISILLVVSTFIYFLNHLFNQMSLAAFLLPCGGA